MSLQRTQATKRHRLIPHKRSLLPARSPQHKHLLNPSAGPAEIQFRRPVFSSVGAEDDDGGKLGTKEEADEIEKDSERVERRTEAIRIEFDSSQAPQPFLDPDVLERIRERRRQRQLQQEEEAGRQGQEAEGRSRAGDLNVTVNAPGTALNTEREIRRRMAQTEYGSMAVRGRKTVRGRRRRW